MFNELSLRWDSIDILEIELDIIFSYSLAIGVLFFGVVQGLILFFVIGNEVYKPVFKVDTQLEL